METLFQKDTKNTKVRNDTPYARTRFRLIERVFLGLVAVGLLAVLIVAAFLRPDPTGMGTHQQLGLPPCSSVYLWGIRCPACGMTTSWSLLLHGRVAEAMNANLGGVLLAVISVVSVYGLCRLVISGDRFQLPWFTTFLVWSLGISLVIATGQWLSRIVS